MADSKISALTAATTVNAADQFAIVQSSTSKMATALMARGYASNASTATVSAGYATDTYLAGSALTVPVAGTSWKAGTVATWLFDMVKTGAGTAAFTITVRFGTLGTTGDAGIGTLAFAVGTGVVDTGLFSVSTIFRSVGAGTGVAQSMAQCTHHLAATGLITTGASGTGIVLATQGSLTFSASIIGLSVNGGASFSGTNTMVQSLLYGL